ncbi:hypothetical protein ABN140_26675 [Klebsiella michiganensis]|uniref:Uncharacterized protein n=1 Tax=Klebsiella pneumoniae TaxID=573 RepID=A0A486VXX1_KLEPN|nr:hypothetical protein [Klebsiella oxytoca]MCW9482089.1 hypothetical protein [Klebsiella oxytoca]VGM55648.1 Uncharacterised protein [Klebsiella pneumoniae]
MLAKIIACQPAEPGTAQLMVRLRGETTILTNLTFTLCNNEQNYLQPNGRWSPAQHWFTVNGGYALNNGSGFRIGPTLLDPLLATASQVQIQIKLDSGETRNTTLQLERNELLSSEARGETGNYSGSSMLATPEDPSEPVIATETGVAPAPVEPIIHSEVRTPVKSGPSRLPVISAVILVLVVIAGALWWFLGRDKSPEVAYVEQTQQETPASAPTAAPEPVARSTCSAQGLNSQNELDFVQSCVLEKLDSDKLLTIIQAAKEAKKCGVAQRLYANRAQSGDTKIAIVYAGEYDPKYHQPSECFKAPDKDTAAYWYETVLQTEPDNQTAKQRLEELGK